MINGNNTNNQDTHLCPALHIISNIHVQKRIQSALKMIIMIVLGTLEL